MKILKFQTKTCTPCKMVDMMLNDMGVDVDEKIDIEEQEDIRKKYDVMKSPTIILVDDEGTEVSRAIGIDEGKIVEIFELAGRL
jgi:glutaredoxin